MALYIEIESFGQQFQTFVSVFEPDGTRRFVCQPFGAYSVDQALIGGGYLWCLSRNSPRTGNTCDLAKIDLQSGRLLKKVPIPSNTGKMFFSERSQRVLVFGVRQLIALDADDVEICWNVSPAFRLKVEKGWLRTKLTYVPCDDSVRGNWRYDDLVPAARVIAEGPDGKFRIPMYARDHNKNERRVEASGIIAIEPETGSFSLSVLEQLPMPGGFGSRMGFFSPDGRFGIRVAVYCEFERLPELDDEHGLALKQTSFFEVWDIIACKLLHVLPCMPLPKKLTDSPGTDDVQICLSYTKFSRACQRLAGTVSQTYPKPPHYYKEHAPHRRPRFFANLEHSSPIFTWESDSRAFWVQGQASLQRVTVEGAQGPAVIPDCFLADKHYSALERQPSGIDLGANAPNCFHYLDFIKSAERAGTKIRLKFLERFNTSSEPAQREGFLDVPENYSAADFSGPLRDDGVAPKKLTANDIAESLKGLVDCKSWKKPDVEKGLAELARKLGQGIETVAEGDGLDLVFKVRGSFLDEWAFFDRLAQKDFEVFDAAKSLLEVWLDALENSGRIFAASELSGPKSAGTAGPMTGALAYLSGSGQDCASILRRFTIMRDGAHEGYSRDGVLSNYLENRDISELPVLRLAVFQILLFHFDGSIQIVNGTANFGWADSGILQVARASLTPAEFLSVITDEIKNFPKERTRFFYPLEGLIEELDKTQEWDDELAKTIADRLRFFQR